MKILNITPQPAPRMTRSDKWKQRPVVTKYFAYKDELRYLCNLQKVTLTSVLKIEFIVPMPKSWPDKKKKIMLYTPNQNIPDIDNYLKAYMDSFGENDGFVHSVTMIKKWGLYGQIIIHEENELL